MLRLYMEGQSANEPVHTWELPARLTASWPVPQANSAYAVWPGHPAYAVVRALSPRRAGARGRG